MDGMEIQAECFMLEMLIKAKSSLKQHIEAMMRGIEMVKPGNTTGDIGHAFKFLLEKKLFCS